MSHLQMMRLPFAALVAFTVVASFACQKAEPKPDALGTTGPTLGGGSTGAKDGSAADGATTTTCPPLSNDGAIVGERYVDTVLPTPLGGTVTAGKYFLTTVNVYTGAGGTTGLTGRDFQETLVLDATTFTDVRALTDNEGGAGTPVNTNGTYLTTITTFALTPVCPAGGTGRSDAFTGGVSLLHLYEGQNEFIYALQ